MRRFPFALLVATLAAAPALAAETGRAAFSIGYLEVEGDARYEPPSSYAGIEVRPRHRPFAGAALALRGSRAVGRALGIDFALSRTTVASPGELASAVAELGAGKAARFFLVDADAPALAQLAAATEGAGVLLFNVSEPTDSLRAERCAANLMHTIPSNAMLADAPAQYLKRRAWDEVLVLRGPLPADREIAGAFLASARKFGLDIAAVRDFVLSNDPRERDKNNVALITAGADHDVVYIADTLGHFARHVPYRTAPPRPVVGTEDLVARAWHWAWERHGAPQLNQRFERRAGRRMEARDWAAWIAVRSLVEAVIRTVGTRTRGTDAARITAFLKSDAPTLDGYKGPGFLHPTHYMDTLGFDSRENRCR